LIDINELADILICMIPRGQIYGFFRKNKKKTGFFLTGGTFFLEIIAGFSYFCKLINQVKLQ